MCTLLYNCVLCNLAVLYCCWNSKLDLITILTSTSTANCASVRRQLYRCSRNASILPMLICIFNMSRRGVCRWLSYTVCKKTAFIIASAHRPATLFFCCIRCTEMQRDRYFDLQLRCEWRLSLLLRVYLIIEPQLGNWNQLNEWLKNAVNDQFGNKIFFVFVCDSENICSLRVC